MMSEGHGDAPADARSFLPRPGEPVEEYAKRLRVLHRDLTLVLQAVERGLAAAHGEPRPEPQPLTRSRSRSGLLAESVEPPPSMTEPEPSPHGPPPPAGLARVEVMPAGTGERRRADEPERGTETPRAEGAPGSEPGEREERRREDGPELPRSFPARPSAVSGLAAEPEWVELEPEDGETFTAATYGPGAAHGEHPPSLVLAGLVAGWLTVLALAIALLFG